jgi:hypothetical protein
MKKPRSSPNTSGIIKSTSEIAIGLNCIKDLQKKVIPFYPICKDGLE